jgi:hypothetical protein
MHGPVRGGKETVAQIQALCGLARKACLTAWRSRCLDQCHVSHRRSAAIGHQFRFSSKLLSLSTANRERIILESCVLGTKGSHANMARGKRWLGGRDSNPDRQSQNLQSYH